MINKLRNKFIAILMGFTAVVLIIGTVAICSILYKTELDSEALKLNNVIEEASNMMPENRSDFMHPEIGGRNKKAPAVNPVLVFMQEKNSNEIFPVSEFSTATIPQDLLNSQKNIFADSKEGFYVLNDAGLVYQKLSIEDKSYIAVSDIENISYWQNTLVILIIGDLLILLVFFVISIFLSRWSLKPVKDAWEKQKQFIADASHDLKTPLAVIMANSQILESNKNKTIQEQSQWIESTHSESEKMLSLINAMLDLARIEDSLNYKDEIVKQFETINLSEVLHLSCLQFDSVAFERQLTFNTDIKDNLILLGVKAKISNMLDTIISNAFKYAPENDNIKVLACKKDRWIIVEICNEKSLINKEDLPHVFDRFYRSDKSRKRGQDLHQSHGLGLAIAKSIAELHGGKLSVKSAEDTGTIFTVKLPAKFTSKRQAS